MEAGEKDRGGEWDDSTADAHAMLQLLGTLKDRAYIMDPKLFNRTVVRQGEVPAANGHFTAEALAHFYGTLGQPLAQAKAREVIRAGVAMQGDDDEDLAAIDVLLGKAGHGECIVEEERLMEAVAPHVMPTRPKVAQGAKGAAAVAIQRLFANDGSQSGDSERDRKLSFGLGYHLYHQAGAAGSDAGPVFGHSGLGGSLAFYCAPANAGIAILVNQLSTTKVPTRTMLQVLEQHVPGLEGSLGIF
jgi:aarF domain-containing kinase